MLVFTRVFPVALVIGLSACGSSGQPMIGYQPTTTLASVPAGTTFTLTPNSTLEYFNGLLTTGNASASIVTTSTGVNLTTPGGEVWQYSTVAGSGDIDAPGVYEDTRDCGAQGCSTNYLVLNGASTLTYSSYGLWEFQNIFDIPGQGPGVFAFGVTTIPNQMPTMGTATYTGGVVAAESITNPQPPPSGFQSTFKGNISLTANFASNTISGAVTGLSANQLSVPTSSLATGKTSGAMNDITLSGTILGSSFAGAATAAAAAANTTFNISGASGRFGGHFYGPSAAEAAGTFSVTNGNAAVIGSFGAHR